MIHFIFLITLIIRNINLNENSSKMIQNQQVLPIFDSIESLDNDDAFTHLSADYNLEDIEHAKNFLKAYKDSLGTFNAYRREMERILQWCALIAKKSLKTLKRDDIENYIQFCQKPPKALIGLNKAPRFIRQNSERLPNPEWKPFIATISKSEHRQGTNPSLKDFEFTHITVKHLFAIIGSFYNYLLLEEYVSINPVAMIRQKSKFIKKIQEKPQIRRLSELQWSYVIQTAKELAEKDPTYHERTLFIMSALYSMYLRISELAASNRWTPKMNHFTRDNEDNWWFTTVGKGNKQRQIAVSEAMLEALKQWRKHLKLSPLPSPADTDPLILKNKGKGPVTCTSLIRKVVQNCFNHAINKLRQDSFVDEAESLIPATVHWLRHTGISDDVKIRPKEHVRDDAGHSSSAITDKYIDIELLERHRSARKKLIET
jgi:site-specific recombinase XerD